MKKNFLSEGYYPKTPTSKQVLRTMRMSTFLLCACAFSVYAETSVSQNARVSINKSNTQLDEILNEIESQTDYLFVYNNQINVNRKVSVKAKTKPVSEVLDNLLKNSGIEYSMEGTHIVLTNETKEKTEVPAQQQAKKVTGTIVDTNGEPIIGANVIVKGTTNGTVTDMNGVFSIEANAKDILNISYIGYLTKELPVGNQKSIQVELLEDTKALDEVVVIGYGTQRKADLTGSVANVSADKLNTQSNANIGQALQGKIAGVDIVSQGGAPGAGTRIMVRGIGTLNNSNPLYIVDGMYMDNIDHINPNDIASIDVLKDASSSAIYGSRAANGVILLTTKKGVNTEGKPMVELSANTGIQTPSKYMELLNAKEWAHVTTVSRAAINLPVLDMATNLDAKPDNDWQKLLIRPAFMQNYNASIRGGSKTYTYYTGLGYFEQEGTLKGTKYRRYTVQFKSDYKKGWFSAGNNIILTTNNDNPMPNYDGGLLGVILRAIPTLEKYDDTKVGGYGGTYGDVNNMQHPLGQIDKNLFKRVNNSVKVFVNLYLQAELFDGLKYKLNVTPDFHFNRYTDYQNKYDFGLLTNSITQMMEERARNNNMLVENLLSYDKVFGDHKVSALLGYSYQDNEYHYLVAKGKGMPDNLQEIDAAIQDRTNGGNSGRSVLTSIIARAFYSYKNKYLLTATLRRDGSSKFAKENRHGNFPSVSVGWNMAEESFLKSVNWLDQFKIRGGYGVLGNQEVGNYMYTSTITTGINYPDGKGGLLQGAFPKTFANPDIKWEQTAMTNIGFDFIALNNRLSVTTDYYVKNTKDILLTVPIPISSGGANDPVRNAGEIRNRGFEINIGWNDRPSKDFSYGVNLIGSTVSNEVIKMGTGSQVIWGGTTKLNISTCKTLTGYPIGGYWLIPTDGYFQNTEEVNAYAKNNKLIQPAAKPGDIRFKDVNEDGIINDDDRTYSGSPFPKMTMSANANFVYKQFDALIGLQGVFGNKIYNATRQALEGVNSGLNFSKSTTDYWTPENPNASHPRLVWDDPNRNIRPESDRYLESGSFFKVRNIQVGYTIPSSLLQGKIDKVRIYVNIEDPFMFTKYTGFTPDVNAGGATNRGFDYFTYPTNRIFMFGLNVSF